jgi:LPXTG-motif cell wall-anchored protein
MKMKKLKMLVFTFAIMLCYTMGANAYVTDFSSESTTDGKVTITNDEVGTVKYQFVRVEKSVYGETKDDGVRPAWSAQADIVKEKAVAFNANPTEDNYSAWRTEMDKFNELVQKNAPIGTWNTLPSNNVATVDLSTYENGDAAVLWVQTYDEGETVLYSKIYVYESASKTLVTRDIDCPVVSNPVCTVENGKYYDNNGNEVTKDEYNKACNPTCKVVDNKYYDDNGNEVTKAEYEKACTNPQTGNTLPFAAGLVIVIVGGAIALLVNRKKLFKQI